MIEEENEFHYTNVISVSLMFYFVTSTCHCNFSQQCGLGLVMKFIEIRPVLQTLKQLLIGIIQQVFLTWKETQKCIYQPDICHSEYRYLHLMLDMIRMVSGTVLKTNVRRS